jgi:uncharacterized membrane protein YphA (DoxX/SURF4 family)
MSLVPPGIRSVVLLLLAGGLIVFGLLAVPAAVPPSVYLLAAAIVTGLTAVMLMTYRNAQTNSSIAQLLHDTETSAPPAPGRRPASSPLKP